MPAALSRTPTSRGSSTGRRAGVGIAWHCARRSAAALREGQLAGVLLAGQDPAGGRQLLAPDGRCAWRLAGALAVGLGGATEEPLEEPRVDQLQHPGDLEG